MRRICVFATLAAGVVLASACQTLRLRSTPRSVRTVTPLPTGDGWRIDRPTVTQAREAYPEIVFRPNDEVLVKAGGCVQTGGSGRTWKRYVDPYGPNSDRLYHGRIWIPGATDSLVRISSVRDRPLIVNKFPVHRTAPDEPNPYYLRLGYEDDVYRDNGYDDHDNGVDNQCAREGSADGGDAWLEIRVVHHPEATPSSRDPAAPFDLWWDRVDDNFLPLGPEWWIHKRDGTFPNSNTPEGCDQFRESKYDHLMRGKDSRCTSWDPDVDEANLLSVFCHAVRPFADSLHGHVNWGPVTYTGRIYFDVSNNFHSSNPKITPPGDGDYDWFFATDDDRGFAEGNGPDNNRSIGEHNLEQRDRHAFALEFSSRETVDHMNGPSWWDTLHRSLDGNDPAQAREMVKGRNAIAIGLIGFDNEHGDRPEGARVELHPVYGLAIRTTGPTTTNSDSEDVWAVFARNWGNEGSCSNGFDKTGGQWQHNLTVPENTLKFFFPYRDGRSAIVTPVFHANYGDTAGKFVVTPFDDGVLLSIKLPEPEARKLFWGELHIKRR